MANPCDIRTMMFMGSQHYREVQGSFYQCLNSERTQSFGYITESGLVVFGFRDLTDCIAAFKEWIDFEEDIENVV